MQLLRAEWYRLSKLFRCRLSPTIQLTDKVKFQSSRLSLLFFFIGKQLMKTLKNTDNNSTEKYRESLNLFLECQSRMAISSF